MYSLSVMSRANVMLAILASAIFVVSSVQTKSVQEQPQQRQRSNSGELSRTHTNAIVPNAMNKKDIGENPEELEESFTGEWWKKSSNTIVAGPLKDKEKPKQLQVSYPGDKSKTPGNTIQAAAGKSRDNWNRPYAGVYHQYPGNQKNLVHAYQRESTWTKVINFVVEIPRTLFTYIVVQPVLFFIHLPGRIISTIKRWVKELTDKLSHHY